VTERQQALMERAEEALEAAKVLYQRGLYNDAASRAYYCMFHVAQAFLEAEGLSFSSHKATIAAFGRHVARKGRVPIDFHRDLIKAQDARHIGDYAVAQGLQAEDIARHLERAQAFLAHARKILGRAQ